MSSSDDLFVTQNTHKRHDSDTDAVLSDILDFEKENMPNFNLDSSVKQEFSDISDTELCQCLDEVNSTLSKRYSIPLADSQRNDISHSRFARKTEAKSKWAVNLFNGWLGNRTELQKFRTDIKHVAGDLLTMDSEMLDYCLGAFIFEIRKENGEEYRGNTLYEIILAIQHFLREKGRFINIIDDELFKNTRNLLDKKMKDLAKAGVGIERQQAHVISVDNEEKMWREGILGSDTPDKLRDTLLYLLGLNFALRGGQEHYNLRVGTNSQLKLVNDNQSGQRYLQYTEDISKCNTGGIDHRKLTRKSTRAYANTAHPERCLVQLYERYMSLRPDSGKCNALYLRSLVKPTATKWYADMRVGINTLSKVVEGLCSNAGLEGYFTNHSLRATAATRMYEANISEQIICEKTGHRSDAVRQYKRTSIVQEQAASEIVQGVKRKSSDDGGSDNDVEAAGQTSSKYIKIRKGDVFVDIPV